jgi:hypothetical protein
MNSFLFLFFSEKKKEEDIVEALYGIFTVLKKVLLTILLKKMKMKIKSQDSLI